MRLLLRWGRTWPKTRAPSMRRAYAASSGERVSGLSALTNASAGTGACAVG